MRAPAPESHNGRSPADSRQPSFDVPPGGSHGAARALESVSGVAAPLLAAACVTVIGVIVQEPGSLAWPSLALALLVLAAAALIAAVQLGVWARQHVVAPAEIAAWWPMMPAEARWHRVREVQWHAAAHYKRWSRYTRISYSIGIIMLWSGVGVALVPDHPSAYRWVPVALAWLTALIEVVWSTAALADPDRSHRLPGIDGLGRRLYKPSYVIPPEEIWPYVPSRDPFEPQPPSSVS